MPMSTQADADADPDADLYVEIHDAHVPQARPA